MYARRPVSRCARCHAQVPLEARFCSECGTWVVHVASGPVTLAQSVPSNAGAILGASTTAKVPQDLALMETAYASMGGAARPSPTGAPPASSLTRDTDVRTIDPRVGPTFPVAGPPAPARPLASAPFGNVPLTPIPSTAEPAPSPSPLAAPLPSFDGPPPLQSRALSTLSGAEGSKYPPPLSIARTPRPLGGFLVSFQYEPLGVFWPLAMGDNRIGRAGVRPDVDVAIADATVSSDQAILTVERGAASIEDRGSTNRTFVNGQPLVAGARAPVRNGDRIRLGAYDAIMVLLPM